jgi:hypothetical protein
MRPTPASDIKDTRLARSRGKRLLIAGAVLAALGSAGVAAGAISVGYGETQHCKMDALCILPPGVHYIGWGIIGGLISAPLVIIGVPLWIVGQRAVSEARPQGALVPFLTTGNGLFIAGVRLTR